MGPPAAREMLKSCAVAMLIVFGTGITLGWLAQIVFGGS